MKITWSQALAWRLSRHFLEPMGDEPVASVIERLAAVPAMDEAGAELAIRSRRAKSRPGEVARALADGTIIKAYAFRGAMHYLSPADGGAYLALRASGRQWELPSWQEYYELAPAAWPAFRETVRAALADGPLTVAELGAAVTRERAYRHLRPVFTEGAGTLIKPLTWQGDMSFGPPRDGQHTFRRLDANPRWAGIWDVGEAGPHAVDAYFRAYGPATDEQVHQWLGGGLSSGRKQVRDWLVQAHDRLTPIEIGGETAYVRTEDCDELHASRPTDAVRLLPGHDQWVMGPGTKDPHVIPPAHRTPVTRKANLVIAGGVVSGTWLTRAGEARVVWFADRGPVPRRAVEAQVAELAGRLERPLEPVITVE